MIKLKHIKIWNFLSYGNSPTSFDFDEFVSTLVRGKNGAGKSTIFLDAVIYALYGKPYRAINKPQLINSINKKDMLVELTFSIGADEYFVRRGMKPNIFDIFKNNQLIEQSAAIKDYQEFFESSILKISEKTFKQIAILGASSYVPFMKLASAQRRELVESILDIEVFSRMNAVLRDRMNSTKEEMKIVDHKVELKKHEAKAQQKLIRVIQDNTQTRVDEYDAQRVQLLLLLAKNGMAVNTINEELEGVEASKPQFNMTEYEDNISSSSSVQRAIARLEKSLAHSHDMDHCPTCKQHVSEEHNESIATVIRSDLIAQNKLYKQLMTTGQELTITYKEFQAYESTRDNLLIKLKLEMSEQFNIKKQILTVDEAIETITSNSADLEAEQDKLKTIGTDAMALIKRKQVLSEEKHLQDVSAQLLKDSGIKTAVVKEYLPVLNQLINKYLGMFNFFVDFTLNENFEEVIKSRGRDVFSYASFSEGEKKRLDFSILMAFRQLASLKNSAKTNILVLDELLDGAFDLEAKSLVQDIVTAINDANVIVVSHADSNNDGFERTIVVEKVGDFSEYSEID